MDTNETHSSETRIERITGGHNRVLVLHTKDSETTIVIPPGVNEHDWMGLEAERNRREAASLFDRAQQLAARAKRLDLAAGLCKPSNPSN